MRQLKISKQITNRDVGTLDTQTGRPVVTAQNAAQLGDVVTHMLEEVPNPEEKRGRE